MTGIVQYITQNYVLILFFAVLILLAVIGYFAEKANNSQREKNKEEINDEKSEKNNHQAAEGMRIDSHTGKLVSDEEIKKIETTDSTLEQTESINNNGVNFNENTSDLKTNEEQTVYSENSNNSEINSDPHLVESFNIIESNNEKEENIEQINSSIDEQQIFDNNINQRQEEPKDILNNNEFDQFSIEFDSLMPKKEVIDTDLLSDIDSLELDKTQKIDLSEVPDLDNIDLPKIKQMTDEEDIWKF